MNDKDLFYYKKLKYKMIIEFHPNENAYFVKFPELPGCLAHGPTPEKALRKALAVKDEWLKIAYESGWIIPEPILPIETSGRITLRTPKSLHARLSAASENEGVSLNTYIVYLLSEQQGKKEYNESFKKLIEEFRVLTISISEKAETYNIQVPQPPDDLPFIISGSQSDFSGGHIDA
jgi:antitoxin HicB